jgi:predicted dehydrogenase
MKKFKVAIIGLGARGYHTYAKYQHLYPERMEIVAVADINPEKVKLAAKEFNVKKELCFYSAESLLKEPRLAELIIIATQDSQHIGHTLLALEIGYDILLEKPIATKLEDCIAIRDNAIRKKKRITVCHVLRYTSFYKKIKEILNSNLIGDVVTIDAIENVGYWHQAHSFVRGNWRNSNIQTPMILQKCCHDFDIFNWLLDKKCLRVSSFGSLKFFNEKNAPENSSSHCFNCKVKDTCPYDAYKIYVSNENGIEKGNVDWPVNIIMENPTIEGIKEALKTSPYGRCVFRCDNNVVDHQVVNLLYEEEVTVSFTMSAFTDKISRQIKIMGTKGEMIGDQTTNLISVIPFGGKEIVYDINKLATDLSGHGGGDNQMMTEMFDALENGGELESSIEKSISSHLIAFAAERSRLNFGENIILDEFDK